MLELKQVARVTDSVRHVWGRSPTEPGLANHMGDPLRSTLYEARWAPYPKKGHTMASSKFYHNV